MSVAIRSSSHRRRVTPKYLLLDNFSGNQLDSGLWIPTDTESKLSVSGGDLVFAGGRTSPGWSDPALVSVESWARQAGLTIEWQVTPGATNTYLLVGFTDGSLSGTTTEAHGFYFVNNALIYVVSSSAGERITPWGYTASTSYWCKIVCRATGAFYYISADSRVTWQLIWIDGSSTTTPLYAFIESYNAALTSAGVKVYRLSPRPPVISAVTPGAPALGLGSEAAVNGEFGADTDWTKGEAWVIDGGVAAVTPRAGDSNLVNTSAATTVVGTWYRGTFDIASITAGIVRMSLDGDQLGPYQSTIATHVLVGRSTSAGKPLIQAYETANLSIDNVSRKPLPFDQTGVLEYIGDAGVKLGIAKANITVAAGYHAGFVICADSATAPTNHIYTYYDLTAGKAYLMKNTTELVAATVAYSAAAELRVVIVGPVTAAYIGLYYDGVLQGTIQGPYDLSAYGTHCHAFQTGSSTIASFTFDTGVGA